ncbi:hypothetical protein K450DRAFT_261162 [Umbelopsis ramanniana AG]|uniref:Uncharacterized protein n=1 Tax=Umbelopsis ramanniana AG TaxID=1314678 RepID=A0AAD5E133_UMBRA|nr:uncharacterized protein K450DRAFT_261162 [Umbelopsis ramanniana AG]KAI8575541.1 hypothetical protein K450DRAFT_261162 [Umbelopsis ramanniana AG]
MPVLVSQFFFFFLGQKICHKLVCLSFLALFFTLVSLFSSSLYHIVTAMSVNVLSAPSSLSAVGNESQLDSAVHSLYKLYHTPPPPMNRPQSRHHRSDSRTIIAEDDYMISYGRENAHSIAQTPALKSKLNKLPAVAPISSDAMDAEMVELIRNTAANARLSMPSLSDVSLRRKPKMNDRIVSFNESPEYITTPSSSDSDSVDAVDDSTEQFIPETPPSPTKRAVKTLRNTVVRGKSPERSEQVSKQSRSRPVSAPPALSSSSSDAQRPNHPLKTIGKWLTDKNKWLNADRTFLY